jgi:predicted small lipoprotein YifL
VRVTRTIVAAAALLCLAACGAEDPYKPTADETRVFMSAWSVGTEADKDAQCTTARLAGREGIAAAADAKLDRPEAFATLLLAACGREGR